MAALSINATISAQFRDLGERLTRAADQIDAGAPVRDADPTWDLIRAVSALLNEQPTFEWRTAMALRSENATAAQTHPLGVLIFEILTLGKSWTGSSDDLAAAGEELGHPAVVDLDLFNVRHWFNRGIAAAGALAYVGEDGAVRLARHQWFSLAGRIAPTITVDERRTSRPAPHILQGAWLSLGIDPATCIYCLHAPFQEIEHFVPRSRGGTNDLSNLFPACVDCNRGRRVGKHDKDPWEWLAKFHPRRVAYFQKLFGIEPEDN